MKANDHCEAVSVMRVHTDQAGMPLSVGPDVPVSVHNSSTWLLIQLLCLSVIHHIHEHQTNTFTKHKKKE